MSARSVRIIAAAVAAVTVGLGVLATAGTADAGPESPAATPLSKAQSITTHLVTQQGLAIALANNVLQVNEVLVEVGYPGSTGGETDTCEPLYGSSGPGLEILKLKRPSKTKTMVTFALYYDSACTEPYVTQTATVTSSHGGNDLAATETSTYRGPGGHTLGTFKATAAADDSARGVALRGVGSFLPTGSSTPVSLGLTCNVAPEGDDQTSSTWHCAGGVAQKFAKLKRSLGSLTPLTLTVQDADTASGFGRVDFTGSKAALRSSTTKLGVGLDATHALTLTGKSTSAGSDATKGTAAQFALFTPRPTGWSITDPKAHTAFSISVTDKSLRLAGKVVDTRTKAVLATVAVDRSGTGTITYRGAKPVKVVSWLLTG